MTEERGGLAGWGCADDGDGGDDEGLGGYLSRDGGDGGRRRGGRKPPGKACAKLHGAHGPQASRQVGTGGGRLAEERVPTGARMDAWRAVPLSANVREEGTQRCAVVRVVGRAAGQRTCSVHTCSHGAPEVGPDRHLVGRQAHACADPAHGRQGGGHPWQPGSAAMMPKGGGNTGQSGSYGMIPWKSWEAGGNRHGPPGIGSSGRRLH